MRYHKIHSQIWNDEKFIALTPEQQRLFFYCLTSPHSNLIGLYILKPGYACEDLKRTEKDVRRDMEILCNKELVEYDPTLSVIYVRNFLTHNPITNPNQIKAARKMFLELPKSVLLLKFSYEHKTLTEGLTERLSEGLSEVKSCLGYIKDKDMDTVKEGEGEKDREYEGKDAEANIVAYAEIIKDLNEQTGKNYLSTTKDTREMIKLLWKQGFRLEHFKQVHLNMATKWKNDPERDEYLRPATLYQPKKFEGYLNAKIFSSDLGLVSKTTQKGAEVFKNFIEGKKGKYEGLGKIIDLDGENS